MKTSLMIIIATVVVIIGFLTFYSQQSDMSEQTYNESSAGQGAGR